MIATKTRCNDTNPPGNPYHKHVFNPIHRSTAWWADKAKGLFAITEEGELGMMNSMVTITHNDSSPELLAIIRRKPFATPTASEKIEYLFKRVKSKNKRPDFESYALEHVFSFQRRIQATKQLFMKRNTLTPLGVMRDYWDRTDCGHK